MENTQKQYQKHNEIDYAIGFKMLIYKELWQNKTT